MEEKLQFEYAFDYETYIRQRLQEIEDLDERREAKKILLEGLGSIIRMTEAKYRTLEQNIYEELEVPVDKYEVVITLIHKGNYDPMNETLYPVAATDLKKRDQPEGYIKTIYLDAAEDVCRKFAGELYFTGRQQGVRYKAVPCQRYRDAVRELYDTFAYNRVMWTTVNTGYLDKFYDVYAEVTEAIGAEEEISDAVDFGEYSRYIREAYLPLWNIERYTFDSESFLNPLPDEKCFEHELQKKRGREQDGYMVGVRDDIMDLIFREDKIYIRSRQEAFANWTAYRFATQVSIDSLGYEKRLLSNHRKDSFIGRYTMRSAANLRTRADLYRRIRAYDEDNAVSCSNYQILPVEEVRKDRDHYYFADMNSFIQDELFPLEERKVLLLDFQAGETKIQLAEMMVRFLVSQIQLELGEYRCVGRIIG